MSNPEITEQTAPVHTGEVLPPEPDARALNPVRHGMGSEHVPPSERTEYAAHVQAVRASSGARGYLQERLADRAALALWRLDRVARYEAAVSSVAQREAAQKISEGATYGAAGVENQAYKRLQALTGESTDSHRADPELSEHYAQDAEQEAATLGVWAAGGEGPRLDKNAAASLGFTLYQVLDALEVPASRMVRAMMGRAARRGEADMLTDCEWEFSEADTLALLEMLKGREHWAGLLASCASKATRKARDIREAQREAEAAHADALALAALPHVKELEKVTRYEAHLERVMYRALHDLEAARREEEGKDTPGPLRCVLDVGGVDG